MRGIYNEDKLLKLNERLLNKSSLIISVYFLKAFGESTITASAPISLAN